MAEEKISRFDVEYRLDEFGLNNVEITSEDLERITELSKHMDTDDAISQVLFRERELEMLAEEFDEEFDEL